MDYHDNMPEDVLKNMSDEKKNKRHPKNQFLSITSYSIRHSRSECTSHNLKCVCFFLHLI